MHELPARCALALSFVWNLAPAVAVCVLGENPTHPPAPEPLARAHAHNDYRHDRPLLDALAHGFSSVEADVFLVDGELLVGHDRDELRPGRTLRQLYLEPLRRRVAKNQGRVYPDGPRFWLLVDVKSDAEATWGALAGELEDFREILTEFRESGVEERAVTAVVSGNRDWEGIARRSPRWAGGDGRLRDLESGRSAARMPLVSDHWGRTFRWRGEGPMPDGERAKLRGIVRRAHEAGYAVRFWATPDEPPHSLAVWRELVVAGVDLVNTDDLAGLARFLRSLPPTDEADPAPDGKEPSDGGERAAGDAAAEDRDTPSEAS